jgi:succinoglycan biosynthesis protein ExoA
MALPEPYFLDQTIRRPILIANVVMSCGEALSLNGVPARALQNESFHAARSELPFASIILPVRNEERYITRTLQCLRNQTYPRSRTEIIVVDGISTDDTRLIVGATAALDGRVLLLDNQRRIMAAGFNLGLKTARGEMIVMMGGHTEVSPNYLHICAALLQTGVADCVGGPIETVGETYAARAIALAMSSRLGVGNSLFRIGCAEQKYVDTVAFGAYTRQIIERTGDLDEEFVRGQDDEFNYRLRKLGGKILIVPQLQSRYASRSSLTSLWRQYFQYGYWKVRILQKHSRQMQWRQFIPALFVSGLFLLSMISIVRPRIGSPLLGGTLFMYGTVVGLTSMLLTRRHLRLAPAVALSFVVLHFSYGLGFLWGLIGFGRYWLSPKTEDTITRRTL